MVARPTVPISTNAQKLLVSSLFGASADTDAYGLLTKKVRRSGTGVARNQATASETSRSRT